MTALIGLVMIIPYMVFMDSNLGTFNKDVEIEVPYRRFAMWDKDLRFGVEEGWFEVWLGKNAEEKAVSSGRVFVK